MTTSSSRLKDMLAQIARALQDRGVRHALVGGLAMAAHGFPRATKDLDLLIARSDAERADGAMRALGFEPSTGAVGFVRYVRRPLPELPELTEWADLLLASREIGLDLLERAQVQPVVWEGLVLPVVPRDGLILMKLLAHSADPRRSDDRRDIRALLGSCRDPSERRALLDAAAELGPDVVALLEQIERESGHEQDERTTGSGDYGL
jgi:hypothetical protein